MAASNKTTPYELPLYESDDTTTWLSDFNNAMLKINTGMVQNSTKAESVVTIADTAVKTAQGAADKVAGYDATIAQQTEDIKLNADNIQHNMQDITDAMTAVNGNTESIKHLTDDVTAVTTTVNQHTADIEELGNEINQLNGGTVVWTNTSPTSPMTATTATITVDIRKYQKLEIWYANSPVSLGQRPSDVKTYDLELLPNNMDTIALNITSVIPAKVSGASTYSITYAARALTFDYSSSAMYVLQIANCNSYVQGQANIETTNASMFPLKIIVYGLKTPSI